MRVKLYIQKNKYSSIIKKLAELIINLASFLYYISLHLHHLSLIHNLHCSIAVIIVILSLTSLKPRSVTHSFNSDKAIYLFI